MSTTNDSLATSMVTSGSAQPPAPLPGSSGFATIISDTTTQVVATSDEGAHVAVIDSSALDSILTRDRLISNITINGTETWNSNILGNNYDPFRLFCLDPFVASMLAPYSAVRADMSVKIVIKPPGSCMGGMVFTALCEGGAEFTGFCSDDTTKDNVFTAFGDIYGVMSFENANDLTFDLPFVYPTDYYDYRDGTFALRSWRMMAYTMVPIQSMISTSAVANIKIYACFKPGYKLCNAFFQGGEKVDGLSGFRAKGAALKSKAQKKVLDTTGGHKISDMASGAASVATTMAGMIPAIAPFAAPIAAGLGAISSVASWLGFTREALVYHPEPVVPRLMSTYAGIDGIDTSERLVMSSDAVLTIDPSVGGGVSDDILSFESLRRRWGLVGAFDLSTSTAVGKIYELPVSPSYGGTFLGNIFLTPAGYYGIPFDHWRGGMEYLIYIPSSSNMRGGLQILWSPKVTASATLAAYSADPTNRLNNVVLDLNKTQQYVIKVPYSSTKMLMDNEIIADVKYANRNDRTCNGSLTFYLTSAYVAPRTGLITTKVLILARPMEDMVFAEPRWSINRNPLAAAVSMQSGSNDDGIDEQNEVFEVTILSAPIGNSFDVARELTSETAPSARALMQKFTEIATVQTTEFTMTAIVPPNQAVPSDGWHTPSTNRDSGTKGAWCWWNHYALLYTGVRGGCRVKLTQSQPYANRNMTDPTAANYPAPTFVMYATQARATDYDVKAVNLSQQVWDNTVLLCSRPVHNLVQTLSPDKACEFAFPYCSTSKYLNPRNLQMGIPPPSAVATFGEKVLFFRSATYTSGSSPAPDNFVTMRVAYAGAEDVSVTRFRRVPGLVAGYLTPVG